ncbi:MAG: hypothetical protein JRN20_10585 [Nitrososphaerota archaeon]|nr:hypothetical protein [Nitrososphaerota archaeon]
MKLRTFALLLGVIAIVAIIYSPSTIGLSSSVGSTNASDTGAAGTSQFVSLLRELGYNVTVVNDSQSATNLIKEGRAVFFIVGPDFAVNGSAFTTVQDAYNSGNLSLFIADGNRTNNLLLQTLFSASVTGAAIHDPTSPFKDNRVLQVSLNLTGTRTSGVMDIASPIVLGSQLLHPVANTSTTSSDDYNGSLGSRTVIAAGISPSGSRSILVSDSSPFTNFLINSTKPANETEFVSAMVNWVTAGNRSINLIYDNFDYKATSLRFAFGIPVGPLFTYFLEDVFSGMNSYYSSYPTWIQGALHYFGLEVPLALAGLVAGFFVLVGIYVSLTRWFAPERRGRDDQPLPKIERSVVAQSRSRVDFLTATRSKSFYVSTLVRLYEVLGEVFAREFGSDVSSLTLPQLSSKLGEQRALETLNLISELRRVYEYSVGKRFLFPPVFSWKRKVSKATETAEEILNHLGMTIRGEANTKGVEYGLRRY